MSKVVRIMDIINSKRSDPPAPSQWYMQAMQQLIGVIQELSQAHDLDAIIAIVRVAARELTGADGATFVLRDGDNCYYADENAISPLWKGKRFPMITCISGWVMMNRDAAIIEDIYKDPRIPADAYRPTFVKSMAMVPIRQSNPIGAIGNYWASQRIPTDEEVAILQALADTTSVALENAELYAKLREKVQRLELQEARIHEQCEALEVFTRALAHDLKEPLRTIHSFSELIAQNESLTRKGQDYFGFIEKASYRMSTLVETVFHYTQLDDPSQIEKEAFSMDETVKAVKEHLHHSIAETGATITSDAMPIIYANPVNMLQVMQNLVSNAIYHGGKHANIHISVEEQPEDWVFSVCDTGPGIAHEYHERIFLPFTRLSAQEGRSGLGLAICRKIIAYHQGKIWCESEPGKGAKFSFTIPKAGQEIQDVRKSGASTSNGNGLNQGELATILIVDDREADIELTKIFLFEHTNLQCNVLVSHSAEETLAILKEKAGNENAVDLVLLDINMPGTDGFGLMEYLRQDETLKGTNVIMCTGSIYEKDKQRAKSLGAVGYVLKPPAFSTLKPILQQLSGIQVQNEMDGYRLVKG